MATYLDETTNFVDMGINKSKEEKNKETKNKSLKSIPIVNYARQQTEYLIYGFIRQFEMICGTIPVEINDICIMFYGIFYICECNYSYDYDKNGICFLLGTNFNKTKWINPAQKGLITLKSSGWAASYGGSINNMVGRTVAFTCTSHITNAWISF
eukprot:28847_1